MNVLRLMFFLLALNASPAFADTDYACLNQCVREGEKSAPCIKKCTYNAKPKPLIDKNKKNNFDQFDALKAETPPSINKPKQSRKLQDKSYGCMKSCLKEGMQYQLCQAQCAE